MLYNSGRVASNFYKASQQRISSNAIPSADLMSIGLTNTQNRIDNLGHKLTLRTDKETDSLDPRAAERYAFNLCSPQTPTSFKELIATSEYRPMFTFNQARVDSAPNMQINSNVVFQQLESGLNHSDSSKFYYRNNSDSAKTVRQTESTSRKPERSLETLEEGASGCSLDASVEPEPSVRESSRMDYVMPFQKLTDRLSKNTKIYVSKYSDRTDQIDKEESSTDKERSQNESASERTNLFKLLLQDRMKNFEVNNRKERAASEDQGKDVLEIINKYNLPNVFKRMSTAYNDVDE